MKMYTVCFKSGGYFTINASYFEKTASYESSIPKIVFYHKGLRVCSVPLGHIDEIYTFQTFGVEREVVYRA